MEATIFLPSLNLSTSLFTRCDHAQWLCQLNTVNFRGNVPIRAVGLSKTCKTSRSMGRFCVDPCGHFATPSAKERPRTKRVVPNGIRLTKSWWLNYCAHVQDQRLRTSAKLSAFTVLSFAGNRKTRHADFATPLGGSVVPRRIAVRANTSTFRGGRRAG